MCIEWCLPCKVLLMCPSVSHPSINHHIRQRHTSLRTRSETRNASTPFLVFSVSSWAEKHIFAPLFALRLCLFWAADCHIRIVCQSKGDSDKAESIYLSISAQPIEEWTPKLANQNAIQTQHPTPSPPDHSLPLRYKSAWVTLKPRISQSEEWLSGTKLAASNASESIRRGGGRGKMRERQTDRKNVTRDRGRERRG